MGVITPYPKLKSFALENLFRYKGCLCNWVEQAVLRDCKLSVLNQLLLADGHVVQWQNEGDWLFYRGGEIVGMDLCPHN